MLWGCMNRRGPSGPVRAAAGLALVAALALAVGVGPARAQHSEADVFVAQAILAYDDKRYEEALDFLRQALDIDPKNVDALYYTGLVRLGMRQPAQALEPLEQARALAPGDQSIAFQLGVAYFALERYDRAEPLLTEVFEANPRADSVGYYVGFMRYRRKDYQGALRAFQAGASTDPNIQQLTRFYSGLAYAVLGLPERAAAEVEAAQAVQPASPLTGPAERLRAAILAARERERRVRAEVRLGFLYDTNVAVNPEPSHDPTAEALRRGDTRTPGQLASVRLEYSWLRTGPWEGTVSYSFFQTINNDVPTFNVESHLGTLGLTNRGSVGAVPYQAGAFYAYDILLLDNDEFTQRHSPTLFGTAVWDATHLSTAQARFQTKEFSDDSNIAPEEVRDAQNWLLALSHFFRFQGDRHFVRIGYQFDVEDADGRNFEYLGHRWLVGGQYTLPWYGMRLRYDYDVHFRSYRHAHTILPERAPGTRERTDTEQTHVLRVEQPLPWSLTLAAEYQASIARSNLPVFSFNRNVYSLTLSWLY